MVATWYLMRIASSQSACFYGLRAYKVKKLQNEQKERGILQFQREQESLNERIV